MDTRLVKNIIATITYYDVLDFPLTSFEVWRHMISAPTKEIDTQTWRLDEVVHALTLPEMRQYIRVQDGFYILAGREKLLRERRKRELISVAKIKKLRRYVRILRMVPFVRMIALTGRLSYKNGEDTSDLDVLIACKEGHIWTGRFLMTLVTQLMGVRRYGKHHADRVCLNYYMTDASLEVPTKDLYAAHEYSFILPLFGKETFVRFMEENAWIKKYKPHYITKFCGSAVCATDTQLSAVMRRMGEILMGHTFIEKALCSFQKKKILSNPKTQLDGAVIIANEEHLVFLPKPHGPRVFSEYQKRFAALELPWR